MYAINSMVDPPPASQPSAGPESIPDPGSGSRFGVPTTVAAYLAPTSSAAATVWATLIGRFWKKKDDQETHREQRQRDEEREDRVQREQSEYQRLKEEREDRIQREKREDQRLKEEREDRVQREKREERHLKEEREDRVRREEREERRLKEEREDREQRVKETREHYARVEARQDRLLQEDREYRARRDERDLQMYLILAGIACQVLRSGIEQKHNTLSPLQSGGARGPPATQPNIDSNTTVPGTSSEADNTPQADQLSSSSRSVRLHPTSTEGV